MLVLVSKNCAWLPVFLGFFSNFNGMNFDKTLEVKWFSFCRGVFDMLPQQKNFFLTSKYHFSKNWMGRVFFAKIRMVLWLLLFSGRPPRDHPGGVRYIPLRCIYTLPHLSININKFWGCLHTLAHRRWGKVYFCCKLKLQVIVASYVLIS